MLHKNKIAAVSMATGVLLQLCAGNTGYAADNTDTAMLLQKIDELNAKVARYDEMASKVERLEKLLKAVDANANTAKEQVKKIEKKASPFVKWSGQVKTGYWDGEGTGKSKCELTLNGDVALKDNWAVKLGVKFSNTAYETNRTEGNKIKLNYASITKTWQLDKDRKFTIRSGTDKASVAEGLWISKESVYHNQMTWDIPPLDHVKAFYGRDAQDYHCDEGKLTVNASGKGMTGRGRILNAFDYRHNFNRKDTYLGAYFGHQQPDTYAGIYGSYAIPNTKFYITGEYLQNTNTDKTFTDAYFGDSVKKNVYKFTGANDKTKAYVFYLGYGHAKKKGDWEAQLEWLHIDQNCFLDNSYSSWEDYNNGQKGMHSLALKVMYAFSKNSKLQIRKYWGRTVSDSRNVNSSGDPYNPEGVNSLYFRFTTKF